MPPLPLNPQPSQLLKKQQPPQGGGWAGVAGVDAGGPGARDGAAWPGTSAVGAMIRSFPLPFSETPSSLQTYQYQWIPRIDWTDQQVRCEAGPDAPQALDPATTASETAPDVQQAELSAAWSAFHGRKHACCW